MFLPLPGGDNPVTKQARSNIPFPSAPFSIPRTPPQQNQNPFKLFLFLFLLLLGKQGKMSLLQIQTPNLFTSSKPISSSYHSPSKLPLLRASSSSSSSSSSASVKPHQESSLFSSSSSSSASFSSSGSRPFWLSAQPRRLLCRPPQGKYVREDYLVVRPTSQAFNFHLICVKILILFGDGRSRSIF